MFRHLPPTATPLAPGVVARALSAGPDATDQLRCDLLAYLDAAACYTAASGRTALFLLLEHLRATAPHQRREVVMPAYTCPSLARVTLDAGLQPRLVDLDIATFGFDLDGLDHVLDHRTLAVLHIHPFGIPVDPTPVLRRGELAGIPVVEDAAQSLGARWHGRRAGTMGTYGLFSLGPGKPISAGGGGILTVNQPSPDMDQLDQIWLRRLSAPRGASALAMVRLAALSAAFHPTGWWLATRAGAQRVGDHEASWGYSLTSLTPAQAAVAKAQLARLDSINRDRRARALGLVGQLAGESGILVPGLTLGKKAGGRPEPATTKPRTHPEFWQIAAGSEPIFLRLPLIMPTAARCDSLYRKLWASGIGVGRMYRRTLSEIFPELAGERFAAAEQVARCLITLPTHHYLSPHDLARTEEIITEENR